MSHRDFRSGGDTGLSPTTMSSRVDSAVPTRLSSIRNELIGKKLRVVGKILSHDVSGSVPWLREPRSIVTLFGYLERSQADMRLPDLPEQLPHRELVLIPHFSLQAILVLDSPDVDLRLWNDTVAEIEALVVTSGLF
ncbi:hypothetical protein BJY52DRAFT_550019 [Lactarius psammicola]|nr:hypothetical protein BJY52DRAFT_550019 [Lactarius psammicola]